MESFSEVRFMYSIGSAITQIIQYIHAAMRTPTPTCSFNTILPTMKAWNYPSFCSCEGWSTYPAKTERPLPAINFIRQASRLLRLIHSAIMPGPNSSHSPRYTQLPSLATWSPQRSGSPCRTRGVAVPHGKSPTPTQPSFTLIQPPPLTVTPPVRSSRPNSPPVPFRHRQPIASSRVQGPAAPFMTSWPGVRAATTLRIR